MVRPHTLLFSLIGLSVPLLPLPVHAQDKCGTVEYEKMLHQKKLPTETETQFEQWMQKRIRDNKLRSFQTQGIQTSTYTIPVVVHVIHNGVGDVTNISDVQILSQIQVMNDDYKRLNADQTNTPSEFLPFVSSIDVQFVLAKQNPEGIASSGITRTQGTKTSWSMSDNSEFKALNYWPAENYLNIWVVNMTPPLIGYAQLPISGVLPGLETASQDRLTDGVAIHYRVFGAGSFNLDPKYNKGRTATHEIGHFFGLRHIWGDATCATDYVADTPFQDSSTTNCPTNPQASCDPSPIKPHKMFQNYLDYTDDACMNFFSQGQVDRMSVILQNSPRRLSLLTSPGATDPVPVADDLGIVQIMNPHSSLCNYPVTPQIEVRNYGNNMVNSAQVVVSVNGIPQSPANFPSLSLNPLQSATLSFNTLTFAPSSSQLVSFQIIQTNGMTDGKPGNNSASVQVSVPVNTSLPLTEPFNSLPAGWQITNPDGAITWANVLAPDGNPANRAMYMNFFGYENVGNVDLLITPAFIISNPMTSQLRFDLAYAQFPGETGDELKVYALPGCNPDLSQGILIYDKSGTTLATTSSTTNSFTPSTASQWRKEAKSLSTLTVGSTWQLAFVARNGYGNNMYVDNIVISDQFINDLAISRIVSPGLVQCNSNPAIKFEVTNLSSSAITSFQTMRSLNGGTVVAQDFNNVFLDVGEQNIFTLAGVLFSNRENTITLTLSNPNGIPDSMPANNSISFNSFLDTSTDSSPLRQTFDNPAEIPWIIASPASAQAWESVGTNKSQSITYRAYSNSALNEESWVVSPVLDLTRYATNTLFFDLGYAQKVPADDRLKILASTDCGLTYPILLYDRAGSEFSVTKSTMEWTPTSNSDWKREYLSLDTLSGKKNLRLAFVATNGNGNNIYIDNIEIFAGYDTNPPVTSLPYQLYYSNRNAKSDLAITFNLPEKKDVRLQIFSMMGQIVADNILPDTFNQTYYFDLSIQATGLYLFRMLIGNEVSTTKVYIAH